MTIIFFGFSNAAFIFFIFQIFCILHFHIFCILHFHIFCILHFHMFCILHFHIFCILHFYIFTSLNLYIFTFSHLLQSWAFVFFIFSLLSFLLSTFVTDEGIHIKTLGVQNMRSFHMDYPFQKKWFRWFLFGLALIQGWIVNARPPFGNLFKKRLMKGKKKMKKERKKRYKERKVNLRQKMEIWSKKIRFLILYLCYVVSLDVVDLVHGAVASKRHRQIIP